MKIAALNPEGLLVYIITFLKGNHCISVIAAIPETGALRSYDLSDLKVIDKEYRSNYESIHIK